MACKIEGISKKVYLTDFIRPLGEIIGVTKIGLCPAAFRPSLFVLQLILSGSWKNIMM